MGKHEIVYKLEKFLKEHESLHEEYHVVYLMVELRKIIAHQANKGEFSLLEFYCDWTVHTRKDYKMQAIQDISNRIAAALHNNRKPTHEDYNSVLNFLKMPELKIEMTKLFESIGLPLDIMNNDNWKTFTKSLARVLANQPINNPIPEIKQITILSDSSGLTVDISFTRGGAHSVGMSHEVY